jgi:hypothetical protein
MKKALLLTIISFFTIGFVVNAQSGSGQCDAPYYIPSACPAPYRPGVSGGYTADLNCQLEKFTDPQSNCCPNKCVTADGSSNTGAQNPDLFWDIDVFGTVMRINPDSTPVFINILFTTVLGLVSLYAIIRGIYVTGVKRTMATTPDEIAEVNKELTNLIIGAALCWGFIILIQVVANFLGVGSLSSLDFSSGDSGTVIIVN